MSCASWTKNNASKKDKEMPPNADPKTHNDAMPRQTALRARARAKTKPNDRPCTHQSSIVTVPAGSMVKQTPACAVTVTVTDWCGSRLTESELDRPTPAKAIPPFTRGSPCPKPSPKNRRYRVLSGFGSVCLGVSAVYPPPYHLPALPTAKSAKWPRGIVWTECGDGDRAGGREHRSGRCKARAGGRWTMEVSFFWTGPVQRN